MWRVRKVPLVLEIVWSVFRVIWGVESVLRTNGCEEYMWEGLRYGGVKSVLGSIDCEEYV